MLLLEVKVIVSIIQMKYDVEGTVSKDIMETRANLNVIIETKLYKK